VTTEDEETVLVGSAILTEVVDHARREAPNECCGLLVGTASKIEECVPLTNVAASPTRFLIDPREHIALNRRLRGSGREVIGTYHSHPAGEARPSATDIAESHYPEFIHVIVSLADPEHADVRAYRIHGSDVRPVALRSFPAA